MSCHSPDIRKSAVSRQCVLARARGGQISEHDVKGNAMTINREDEPE